MLVRDARTDHEAGRVPVIPKPLTSMFCKPVSEVQADGMVPVTLASPLKLRRDRVVSVDQDDGRLPVYPPLPNCKDTSVLTWLVGKGNGRVEYTPPADVPDPFPTPFKVPTPGILEKSRPMGIFPKQVTSTHPEAQGSVP